MKLCPISRPTAYPASTLSCISRRSAHPALLALIVFLWVVVTAQAAPPNFRTVPGEIVVRLRGGAVTGNGLGKPQAQGAAAWPESLESLNRRWGLRTRESLVEPRAQGRGARAPQAGKTAAPPVAAGAGTFLLRLDPRIDLDQAVKAYQADPHVLLAEPNYRGTLAGAPTDPLYPQTRDNLTLIGMEAAWAVQPGANAAVKVAVIDSGVDATHPDLAGALDLADSYNFADGNTQIFDASGHGTRVAGIIGATGNNGEGIAGIAYGCQIMALDVADTSGTVTTARVASAVNWAAAHGAQIINLSLSFSGNSQLLQEACDAAAEAGALLVAAAGNENQGISPVYPASYDSVLGVGAVLGDGVTRAPWSNYNGAAGKLVDLLAPGEDVFSTIPGGQYNGTYGSGTSFAAPMAAGVAALLKAHNPLQSGGALRQQLLKTCQPATAGFQPAGGAGAGLLSAQNALQTPMLPALEVVAVTVDDAKSYAAANDGNGALDKGETVRLVVSLRNRGADAPGLQATLATTQTLVTLGRATDSLGTILSGATAGTMNGFTSVTLAAASTATALNLSLTVSNDAVGAGHCQQTLHLKVPVEQATAVKAGNYFTAQHWTADKTYAIQGTQNFNAGLTIDPGTVVKLAPGVNLNINGGTLTAEGTAGQPILFTALQAPSVVNLKHSCGPQNEPVDLGRYGVMRYVAAQGGSDTTGDGTAQNPWATVPYALSQTSPGTDGHPAALLVAEGTYAGATVQLKPNVDLYGGFEAQGWTRDLAAHPTILDGEGRRQVVMINGAVNSRLDGFTVMNGFSTTINGGGVFCNVTSTTLCNNVFLNNKVNSGSSGGGPSGGGVYCEYASPLISHNLFIGNTVSTGNGGGFAGGGGIACVYTASPTICWNIIAGNRVDNGTGGGFALGGGIVSKSQSAPVIEQNLIVGNASTNNGGFAWGGGLACMYAASGVIRNNAVVGNRADSNGGGIACDYGSSPILTNNTFSQNVNGGVCVLHDGDPSLPTLKNNILYGDTGYEISPTGLAVSYCDVQGGYAGANNLNADPGFTGLAAFGVVTAEAYDAQAGQSVATVAQGALTPGALAGQVIAIGASYYPVLTNTESTITVWGNIAQAGGLPLAWSLPDLHLGGASPCVDAGTNSGAPAADLDGNPRPMNGGHSATIDLGAYEYDPASSASSGGWWGQIYLKNSAGGSALRYCTVEAGQGVSNDSTGSSFTLCQFRNNMGWGLRSTAGHNAVTSCSAVGNKTGGISASGENLAGCQAQYNLGQGLAGAVLLGCAATGNAGMGLGGTTATLCQAIQNGGIGIQVSRVALGCLAQGNVGAGIQGQAQGSQALQNGGAGISGSASGCETIGNGGGGISGSASGCRVIGNRGTGVSGSATLTDCEIRGNTGAAAAGAKTVSGCRITGNGAGISGATAVFDSYLAANGGTAISGASVSRSTIVGNVGTGLSGPAGVSDCWVMFNTGVGIDAPAGNVDHAAIRGNGGYGVRNSAAGATVNFCNLYGNGAYDVYDDTNNAAGGYPANVKDYRYNYWGPASTAEMSASPFPSAGMSRIYDLFSNLLSNGWYINYGGASEITSATLASAPDDRPPAFLLAAVPNTANAVNVGLTTFTLVFSKPMDVRLTPSVTFGLAVPFTAHVVEPAPGWLDDGRTWQGRFAVQSDTGDGLNTICVSNATDAAGFVIPDDTVHAFRIDTTGGLAANKGTAVATGTGALALSWSIAAQPRTALGFNVLRSTSGLPGSYQRVNKATLTQAQYVDTGLAPASRYFYMITLVDSQHNATQWTPPFTGLTVPAPTPTPTPTPTPKPTATPTPRPTPTPTPLPTGSVSVTVIPANASWSFKDASGNVYSGTGNRTRTNVPAGLITLTWNAPAGFLAPSPNPVTRTLTQGDTVSFFEILIPSASGASSTEARLLRYLLGLGTDATGLDLNLDKKVNAADLLLSVNALPPAAPATPNPADRATAVSTQTNLDWADCLRAKTYQLYLWKAAQAKPVKPTTSTLTTSAYHPAATLASATTYKWQVIALNGNEVTTGPVWSFTTRPQPAQALVAAERARRH